MSGRRGAVEQQDLEAFVAAHPDAQLCGYFFVDSSGEYVATITAVDDVRGPRLSAAATYRGATPEALHRLATGAGFDLGSTEHVASLCESVPRWASALAAFGKVTASRPGGGT